MLLPKREQKSDLRTNTGHTTFEIAELCAGAAIPGELLKEISGNADLDILAHELRCGQVDMQVDSVLVLQVVVDEVVRQASDDRKFMSGFGIEIGVPGTPVDRHPTEAEIGKAGMIVSATGDISGEIDHRVVNALVPLERSLIKHVGKGGPAVRDAASDPITPGSGQCVVNADVHMPGDTEHADASLSA